MWQKSQRHDFRRVEALHCSSSEEACIRVSSRSEVGWRRWRRSRSRWSPSRRGAPASSCPSPRCQSHPPSARWARWTSCDEDMKLMQVNYKLQKAAPATPFHPALPVTLGRYFLCVSLSAHQKPNLTVAGLPEQTLPAQFQDEGRDQVLQANW